MVEDEGRGEMQGRQELTPRAGESAEAIRAAAPRLPERIRHVNEWMLPGRIVHVRDVLDSAICLAAIVTQVEAESLRVSVFDRWGGIMGRIVQLKGPDWHLATDCRGSG